MLASSAFVGSYGKDCVIKLESHDPRVVTGRLKSQLLAKNLLNSRIPETVTHNKKALHILVATAVVEWHSLYYSVAEVIQ